MKELIAAIRQLSRRIDMLTWGNWGDILRITGTQRLVLQFLDSHPQHATINAIADVLYVKHATASESVKSLREKGLVKCEVNSRNPRQRIVSMTPKGQHLLKEIKSQGDPLRQALTSLAPRDQKYYYQLTQQILELLGDATK